MLPAGGVQAAAATARRRESSGRRTYRWVVSGRAWPSTALTGRRRQGHTLDALKAIKRSADAANEGVNNAHSTNLRDDLDGVQATVTRLETGLDKLDSKVDVLADMLVDFERCSRQRDEATQARADTAHAAMHRRLEALEEVVKRDCPEA